MSNARGKEAATLGRRNGEPDIDELRAFGIEPGPEAQHGIVDEAAEERAAVMEFDGGLPRAEAERAAGLPPTAAASEDRDTAPRIAVVSATKLIEQHPQLRPAVIDGLLRQGETANVVSLSKVGKSWLGYGLLLSVVSGLWWLGRFACVQGRVLLIDNELHPETIAHRIATVAAAMGLHDNWRDSFDIISLRGQSLSLPMLNSTIHRLERGEYRAVVADAWYRFMPPGCSENDNAAVMQLYNLVDNYADHLGAAWVNIHHATKGDQSAKAVTDVGAGAGSQSRAADCHLILRPHEEDGVVVLQAVVRSFPPIEPLALRWSYPLWLPATDVDPERLKRPNRATAADREAKATARLDLAKRAIVQAMLRLGPATKTQIRDASGVHPREFGEAFGALVQDGTVVTAEVPAHNRKTPYQGYRLAEGDTP
jgi:hypothetical protein